MIHFTEELELFILNDQEHGERFLCLFQGVTCDYWRSTRLTDITMQYFGQCSILAKLKSFVPLYFTIFVKS